MVPEICLPRFCQGFTNLFNLHCQVHDIDLVSAETPHHRLVWGLVHSKKKADIDHGSQLASVLMQSDDMDARAKKDLVYFQCVALYKLGRYVDAKRQLEEFLSVIPASFPGLFFVQSAHHAKKSAFTASENDGKTYKKSRALPVRGISLVRMTPRR